MYAAAVLTALAASAVRALELNAKCTRTGGLSVATTVSRVALSSWPNRNASSTCALASAIALVACSRLTGLLCRPLSPYARHGSG